MKTTYGNKFCYLLGTRVRLGSGGPMMVVVDLNPNTGYVECEWREDGILHEGKFKSICLDIVRNIHLIDDTKD